MSPISCCVAMKQLELQPFIKFNFGLTATGSEIIKRQIHGAYLRNIILCIRAPCIPVLFEVMLSRPLRQIVTLKALSSNLGVNNSQSSFLTQTSIMRLRIPHRTLAQFRPICFAATTVIIHEDIAEKFATGLKVRFEMFKNTMGDPLAKATFLGPLADKVQTERIRAFFEQGRKDGWSSSRVGESMIIRRTNSKGKPPA